MHKRADGRTRGGLDALAEDRRKFTPHCLVESRDGRWWRRPASREPFALTQCNLTFKLDSATFNSLAHLVPLSSIAGAKRGSAKEVVPNGNETERRDQWMKTKGKKKTRKQTHARAPAADIS